MSPRRHSGAIWWWARLTEGCWSIPEALQTQLSVGAHSARGQHAADGVNHAIKWKIDLLCCHRDKLQYSLPIGPPEETEGRVCFPLFLTRSCSDEGGSINSYCAFTASSDNKIIKLMFVFTSVSSAERHPSVNQRPSWSSHTHLTLHPDMSDTVGSHCGSWMHCRLNVMQNLQQQNQQINIPTHCCHLVSLWVMYPPLSLIFKLWQYPLMLDNGGN